MSELKSHMEHYRSQHTTLGCKLTHLVGVPLIALSLPVMLFNWRRGVALFTAGWALQFMGHWVFEKNSPVLGTADRSPLTVLAALLFITEGWLRVLTGQPLVESHNGSEPD